MNTANETILYIDLKKLEKNFNYFKKKLNPKTKIIGVVKAFAYGHGDIYVSKKLEKLGVYALWVSDFEEGVVLRNAGIKTKIIVANPGIKSYQKIIESKLDVVLYNNKLLDLYCLNKNKTSVHIKFNTGMNRYGFNENEVESIVSRLEKNPHLHLSSICSHLAFSNNKKNPQKTLNQINCFQSISKKFDLLNNKKTDKHILNSHGVLNFPEYQMNAVRLGIGLYGSAAIKKLYQISSLSSVITQIKELKKGEYVGYAGKFQAQKKMKIGIVPVGYADGLNRRLSNGVGRVFVKNYSCKIIGEISMDSFAIDITNNNIKEGDPVEIFGDNIAVKEVAKKAKTIPYEIYCTLNRRIKRIYSDS